MKASDLTRNEMTQAIGELEQEAAQAGDNETVADCGAALHGDEVARARCERLINDNRKEHADDVCAFHRAGGNGSCNYCEQ